MGDDGDGMCVCVCVSNFWFCMIPYFLSLGTPHCQVQVFYPLGLTDRYSSKVWCNSQALLVFLSMDSNLLQCSSLSVQLVTQSVTQCV